MHQLTNLCKQICFSHEQMFVTRKKRRKKKSVSHEESRKTPHAISMRYHSANKWTKEPILRPMKMSLILKSMQRQNVQVTSRKCGT